MVQDVLQFAQERVLSGERVALVTVTKTSGSSPASVGQMIAVAIDGTSSGTVGGGTTEFQVKKHAVKAIQAGEIVFSFFFDHSESGMVCGGEMSGYGTILGNENHLYIYGGGHVGQSLAPLAVTIGFQVTVVDDRPEMGEGLPETIRYVCCPPADYEKMITLTGQPYAVICTRGHKTDDDALRFCLGHAFGYIGMIGSSKKVATLFQNLKQSGYTQSELENVYNVH